MLADRGPLPAGPEWAWEMKWDGARCLVATAGDRVRLTSRSEREVTRSYPELGALPEVLHGRPVLLDGELVALDEAGRPRFRLLQERLHVRTPSAALLARVPVHFYVFDLLYLDGEALLGHAFRQRRARLAELGLEHERVRVSPVWQQDPGSTDAVGPRVLQAARDHGLEGAMAKRLGGHGDAFERPAGEDHRVPVPGRAPRHELPAPASGQVVAGGDQQLRLRIQLGPLAAELLEHVVGHDDAGFADQAEAAQLHAADRHLGGLARPDLVIQPDGGFVDHPRHGRDLV
jgi:hypothetical protein